jgi:hypothetical protein
VFQQKVMTLQLQVMKAKTEHRLQNVTVLVATAAVRLLCPGAL